LQLLGTGHRRCNLIIRQTCEDIVSAVILGRIKMTIIL
jgi:hypothetical protein